MFLLSCAQEETWDTLTTKGRKAQQVNRLAEAEDYFLRALLLAQALSDNDKQLSKSYFRLGILYHYLGYYPKKGSKKKKGSSLLLINSSSPPRLEKMEVGSLRSKPGKRASESHLNE
jgi:hypothetical protein